MYFIAVATVRSQEIYLLLSPWQAGAGTTPVNLHFYHVTAPEKYHCEACLAVTCLSTNYDAWAKAVAVR